MYAAERRQAIASHVTSRGRASVTELAARFDVTTETVRRDLDRLARHGLLERVHGGAIPAGTLPLERALEDRQVLRASEKDAIAAAALELLPPRGSICLDGGTTTHALARQLPHDSQLQVLTNSIPITTLLATRSSLELHVLGGRVRGITQAMVGDATALALGALRPTVLFLGTNGLSLAGATTPDPHEAAAKRAMVRAAATVVVVTDSTKLGVEHLQVHATLDEIDVLVTDRGADPTLVAAIEARDVKVVLA